MSKCVNCGYDPENVTVNRPITAVMNKYVDDATGKLEGVFNAGDDYITVAGKKLRRANLEKGGGDVKKVGEAGKLTTGLTAPTGVQKPATEPVKPAEVKK